MADQRRFDTLEQTAARTAQQLAADTSTIYGRLATHTHPEYAPATHKHSGAFALFTPTSDQSFPSTTTTAVAFGTTQYASPEVNRLTLGAGHTFFLSAGIWAVQVFCRIQPGGSAAFTGLNLATTAAGHATALAAETTNGISILSQTVLVLAASGDSVTPSVYHERGTSLTCWASQSGIRFARVGVI